MIMSERVFKIKDCFGKDIDVIPKLFLYSVLDFMGQEMVIPGIQLYTKEGREYEPYATLTVSFGEFISLKNSAYIDVNNCPFAEQILSYGIAKQTQFTKASGFCVYPLWVFSSEFLEEVGGEQYLTYSKIYDDYMNQAMGGISYE